MSTTNGQVTAAHPPVKSLRLPTSGYEKEHVHKKHGEDSWQAKILHFVHKPVVEFTLMGLLVADIVILFVELYIAAEFPPCYIIERDSISCCPAAATDSHGSSTTTGHGSSNYTNTFHNNTDNSTHHRFLAGTHGTSTHGSSGHHSFCTEGIDGSIGAACDPHAHPAVHDLHLILRSLTLFILGTFFIELLFVLAAMGFSTFMKHFWYVFDLVIVTVSLGIEISFLTVDQAQGQLALGLLIMARLWRFVRIGHGIIATTHELSTKEHERNIRYTEELEKIMEEKGIPLPPRGSIRNGH